MEDTRNQMMKFITESPITLATVDTTFLDSILILLLY
jgi:hypothetical protein